MTIDLNHILKILSQSQITTDDITLNRSYKEPIFDGASETPRIALFPNSTSQISRLMTYFRTIKDINIVVLSSKTNPKFLNDTAMTKDTVVLDLSKMKEIPFINKRNKVCVIEPGVTWGELVERLNEHGMRPLAPFLPRVGKSALASVLDREPHMIPKKQFDISDPLLCMELVFGNGKIFRTGEAAGPQSIEENRRAGAALTNPLGPGQTDIFRLIQGSKGTFACVSWISMQCDLIPKRRVINFVPANSMEPLIEFIYDAVRRRLVDEIFIINDTLLSAIFPKSHDIANKFILIYSINGYEKLYEEKIAYQIEDCAEILNELMLNQSNSFGGVIQDDIEPLLDGNTVAPHPKYSENTISIDLIYNTTLNRVQDHYRNVERILELQNFPLDRLRVYVQPVIQARATQLEFSLLADKPFRNGSPDTSYEVAYNICKEITSMAIKNGGFFSRSYKLINEFAFSKHPVHVEALEKLKGIFDPDKILNRGELC